jgi:hypothetical protein
VDSSLPRLTPLLQFHVSVSHSVFSVIYFITLEICLRSGRAQFFFFSGRDFDVFLFTRTYLEFIRTLYKCFVLRYKVGRCMKMDEYEDAFSILMLGTLLLIRLSFIYFRHYVQAGSDALPASCLICTGNLFRVCKVAGARN